MKKLLKILMAGTFLVLLLSACSNANNPSESKKAEKAKPTESALSALSNLKKLGDGVYSLDFEGDYFLDDLIESDSNNPSTLMAYFLQEIENWKTYKDNNPTVTISLPPNFACSSIAAKNSDAKGGQIYGRNFDWSNDCAILMIHTKPYKGYESISTSCLEFLGLNRDWDPATSPDHGAIALAAIHVPMDGMNEKGLYVSVLVTDGNHETRQTTDKHDVVITVAMRAILDNAASVDEAIKILKSIDICSAHVTDNGNTGFHLAIADNKGKSVVVEWYNNEMYVKETPVVTNHYLTDEAIAAATMASYVAHHGSLERYETLMTLKSSANSFNQEEIRNGLDSAKQDNTVWSVVYEPKNRRATYYFRRDFTKPVVVEF